MCHNYLDAAECSRESVPSLQKEVLHLDLSDASFSGIIMNLKSLNAGGHVEGYFTNSSLGLANALQVTKDADANSELY